MKNSLTPAVFEPATFRFVAQHLNHCVTGNPRTLLLPTYITLKYFLRVFPDNVLYFPIQHYRFPFIMDTDRVLCEIRTKLLSRIYANFSLRRVTDMCVFLLYFTMSYINSYSSLELTQSQPNCTRIFSPQKHISSTYTICDELCHTLLLGG